MIIVDKIIIAVVKANKTTAVFMIVLVGSEFILSTFSIKPAIITIINVPTITLNAIIKTFFNNFFIITS